MNKKQKEVLKNNFKIYEFDETLELEQWTNGGVDMIIDVTKKNIINDLEDYIENFDIDEEIDMYREIKDYKERFTIRQSLEDFEDWLEFIEDIIKKLKEAE
jgi:hypothetical protein